MLSLPSLIIFNKFRMSRTYTSVPNAWGTLINFRTFVPTPRTLFGPHRLLIVEKSSNLLLGKIVFSKACYHFRNFYIDKEANIKTISLLYSCGVIQVYFFRKSGHDSAFSLCLPRLPVLINLQEFGPLPPRPVYQDPSLYLGPQSITIQARTTSRVNSQPKSFNFSPS